MLRPRLATDRSRGYGIGIGVADMSPGPAGDVPAPPGGALTSGGGCTWRISGGGPGIWWISRGGGGGGGGGGGVGGGGVGGGAGMVSYPGPPGARARWRESHLPGPGGGKVKINATVNPQSTFFFKRPLLNIFLTSRWSLTPLVLGLLKRLLTNLDSTKLVITPFLSAEIMQQPWLPASKNSFWDLSFRVSPREGSSSCSQIISGHKK